MTAPAAAGEPNRSAANRLASRRPTIWRYFRRYAKLLVRGSVGGVGYNTLIVLGPILLGRAVDTVADIIVQGRTPALEHRLLWLVLGLVMTTFVFQGFRSLKRWDFQVMSNSIGNDLRREVLATAQSLPMGEYERERIGDLLSRGVGDIDVITSTIMTTVTELYDTGILMASYFVVLLWQAPVLTLLCSIPVPVAVVVAQKTGGLIFERSLKARQAAAKVNDHLQRNLNATRVLRLFGREPAERHRFVALCRDQLRANLALTAWQSGLQPVYAGLASLGLVGVVAVGGGWAVAGRWTVGTFTAYLTMFLSMSGRTMMAAQVLNRLHAGRAAWNRVRDKIDLAAAGGDGDDLSGLVPAAVPGGGSGVEVRVSHLTFRFPNQDRPALDDISFEVPAGSLVGVTGPVGAGKSALATVLTGLYPYEGHILLDGQELSDLPVERRRRLVSYTGQDPFLFSASIRENVTAAAGGSPQALERALYLAALTEDMVLFPEGEDTVVGEMGVRVSGGQRQRIALARSVYRGAAVLLLDEPFSALDIGTERRLVDRLREAMPRTTIFLFSHRLRLFEQADLVVLLADGRIQAQGSHTEMMAAGGLYARIFETQRWMEERST